MRQRYCLYGLVVTIIVRYNDHWLPASRWFQLQNDWQTFSQTGTEATPIQINKHTHTYTFLFAIVLSISVECVVHIRSHIIFLCLFAIERTHTPTTRITWISILLFSSPECVCVYCLLCACVSQSQISNKSHLNIFSGFITKFFTNSIFLLVLVRRWFERDTIIFYFRHFFPSNKNKEICRNE